MALEIGGFGDLTPFWDFFAKVPFKSGLHLPINP
jgi:hypothetical protein